MITHLFVAGLTCAAFAAEPAPSVLLIGWDGADARRVEALLQDGRLPHLSALVKQGAYSRLIVTTGATETKPGWAEILTGHDADAMGIENNVIYRPIPPGESAFEKFKSSRPDGCTALVAGKDYNLGRRGPHEICTNCEFRAPAEGNAQTGWWDRAINRGRTRPEVTPRWVRRDGEPLHHAASAIDRFEIGLGSAAAVGPAALEALKACGERPFLIFAHFQDPDEAAHRHTDASAEYAAAITESDGWLGRLLAALPKRRRSTTTVIVATDHGVDQGTRYHQAAVHAWAAGDRPGWRAGGDRKDVGATVLDALGLPVAGLKGVPLRRGAGVSAP